MSLLHSLHRNVKTIAMPMGMVVGALLCRPVTAAESMSNGMITPDADLSDAVFTSVG
mgnify:FL=1